MKNKERLNCFRDSRRLGRLKDIMQCGEITDRVLEEKKDNSGKIDKV